MICQLAVGRNNLIGRAEWRCRSHHVSCKDPFLGYKKVHLLNRVSLPTHRKMTPAGVVKRPYCRFCSRTCPRSKRSTWNPQCVSPSTLSSKSSLRASLALPQTCLASTLIPLEMWDCPGNITVDTLDTPLSAFSSIVFVIDIRVSALPPQENNQFTFAKDLYQQPIVKLVEFIVAACQVNPNVNFEVFVHKAEKLQEDDKIGRILRPLSYSPQ